MKILVLSAYLIAMLGPIGGLGGNGHHHKHINANEMAGIGAGAAAVAGAIGYLILRRRNSN